MGSGGQVTLTLQDNYRKQYKIKRILGESPHVLDDQDQVTGAKISSILQAPLYFGQKDLSSMDNGFELELLNKLVGEKTKGAKGKKSNIDDELANTLVILLCTIGFLMHFLVARVGDRFTFKIQKIERFFKEKRKPN